MKKREKLKGVERMLFLNELERRYRGGNSFRQEFIFLRKKYSWLIVIGATKIFKRWIDVFFSIFLMILFSPFFLIIPLLIKLQDGGPVFFVTNRVGKWGKEFSFPKFRTMCLKADLIKKELSQENEKKTNKIFKMKNDPRITFLGRILRKTSLDELPQLWSVLKGDMSLVGPRPPLPEEVSNYTLEERRRLDIKPGLTGIWQVSGRSDTTFTQQVKLDLEYIESHSIWGDLMILLKTIPAVLLGKGAY